MTIIQTPMMIPPTLENILYLIFFAGFFTPLFLLILCYAFDRYFEDKEKEERTKQFTERIKLAEYFLPVLTIKIMREIEMQNKNAHKKKRGRPKKETSRM